MQHLLIYGVSSCFFAIAQPPGCQHADRFVSEADAPVYKLTVPCVQLDFSATYSVVARNLHGEAKAAISLQVYVHEPADIGEKNR
ncbi:hypothetical protein OUZ56_029102 [Daphnia magna]|uniref:Uncharacterized protein n=1 Tax=Daphnia magna TaxID=35525 RepID=A0ABR0B5U1_9CRUS|nr:hypothetical protein OUZ56_029102 [Daphnia magna]